MRRRARHPTGRSPHKTSPQARYVGFHNIQLGRHLRLMLMGLDRSSGGCDDSTRGCRSAQGGTGTETENAPPLPRPNAVRSATGSATKLQRVDDTTAKPYEHPFAWTKLECPSSEHMLAQRSSAASFATATEGHAHARDRRSVEPDHPDRQPERSDTAGTVDRSGPADRIRFPTTRPKSRDRRREAGGGGATASGVLAQCGWGGGLPCERRPTIAARFAPRRSAPTPVSSGLSTLVWSTT